MNHSKSSPTEPPQDAERNPVESIASEVVDSMRVGRNPAFQPIAEANPNHESELRELLPLVERLEKARMAQRERPNGLASLGAERPDRLGDFELIRQIGRGGMGVVFEAVQRSLGRRVALKVLPKTLLSDERQLKRFQREAKMAGALHHTNIVPVFGVGEDQGFHYFVMQCIDGRGLDRLVCDPDSSERLSAKRVAHLGQQAALALAYAHSQNVLHRDIKPANLIVNSEDQLWVTDFGVAKAIESEAVTKTGDVVGTLRYMAPEQIVGSTDVRSDIYSLGVTLYELLAGRPALDDASIRSAIISRKPAPSPPPLRQLNPQVPRDLETILNTAMSTIPDSRYASADAMAHDLQCFLDGEAISVRRESFIEIGLRWARRNPAVAALTSMLAIALTGLALLSTIGYLQVQDALHGEQLARSNAEETAELAVGALDQVFERFSVTSTDPTQESGTQFAATPALSVETAELLEDLLVYFDELASQGHTALSLQRSAINAQYSIGDIHFQLGHYKRSIECFELALRQANESSPDIAIRKAKIHNRIGFAQQMLGNADKANLEHEKALLQLTGVSYTEKPLVIAHQYELARTHFLLGQRLQPSVLRTSMPPYPALNLEQVRRGELPPLPKVEIAQIEAGRGDPDHLGEAILILRKLCADHPDNVSFCVALASCLRQIAGDSLSKRTSEELANEEEALKLLRDLQQKHPDDPTVLVELASALSSLVVFERMDRETHWEASERCREAVKYCELLVATHPNVPSYNNALIHTWFRLGVLLERMSERERQSDEFEQEASDAFEQAAKRQKIELHKHPDEIGYQAWYAVFLMRYGDITSRAGSLEQAADALEESAKAWLKVCDIDPNQSVAWDALPHVYRILSQVQHRLGRHHDAKASQTEGEMYRIYRDTDPNKLDRKPPRG